MRSRRNPLIEIESDQLKTGRSIDGIPIFYKVKIISMEPWLDSNPLNNWRASINLYIWDTNIAQIEFSHTDGSYQDPQSVFVQNEMYSLYLFDQGELGLDITTLPTVVDVPKVSVDRTHQLRQLKTGLVIDSLLDLLYTLAIKFSYLILEQYFIFVTDPSESTEINKYFYFGNGEEDRFHFVDDPSLLFRILRSMTLPNAFVSTPMATTPIETGFKQFPVRMSYTQSIGTIDETPIVAAIDIIKGISLGLKRMYILAIIIGIIAPPKIPCSPRSCPGSPRRCGSRGARTGRSPTAGAARSRAPGSCPSTGS